MTKKLLTGTTGLYGGFFPCYKHSHVLAYMQELPDFLLKNFYIEVWFLTFQIQIT